jgi:hypothetical protein
LHGEKLQGAALGIMIAGVEVLQVFPKDLIKAEKIIICWRRLCLIVAVRSLGFLTAQSVKAVFLREAGTAGTSVHTTCGANISS